MQSQGFIRRTVRKWIAATTASRRETKSSCAAIASIPLVAEWSAFGVGPSGFSVGKPGERCPDRAAASRVSRAGQHGLGPSCMVAVGPLIAPYEVEANTTTAPAKWWGVLFSLPFPAEAAGSRAVGRRWTWRGAGGAASTPARSARLLRRVRRCATTVRWTRPSTCGHDRHVHHPLRDPARELVHRPQKHAA